MSTNYFAILNHCECCNRSNKLHIGKSSWGWAFMFRGYSGKLGFIEDSDDKDLEVPEDFNLKSWNQWKEYLKDKPIIDEYNDIIDYSDFVNMVEGVKSPDFVRDDGHKNKDHITEILNDNRYVDIHKQYTNPDLHWHDEDGYSFSANEFS